MSSKRDDSQGVRRSRRWAMATWLSWYYTLSAFILLAIASIFLDWKLERSVEQDNRDRLIHKIQVLTSLLQEQPFDSSGIEQEVREEAEISSQSQSPFFLRVLNSSNALMTETPGMASMLPIAVFPRPTTGQPPQRRWQAADGSTFMLASSLVSTAIPTSQSWHLQAALNTSASERLLAGYRRSIVLVLLGGLLIAAPIGIWITRRGLRPIADITRATERIGAQQLQYRINADHWPQELLAMATAFDRMLDRLQEAFDRLSQFSADLAHEMRTPINNLMGEGQVTLSRKRTESEYVRVLQSALEEHGRLARMIDSMLFLAQADQAGSPLTTNELDARSELQAVADFYHALAEEQGVELIVDGDARVLADPMLLRRAVSNLLSNAMKYTPRGGRIELTASKVDNDVLLSVIDSGVGIADEHLHRLGDRFYRVDPSRTDSATGSGLGLAIVRSIMVLHGGKFLIESIAGKGTAVRLVFVTP